MRLRNISVVLAGCSTAFAAGTGYAQSTSQPVQEASQPAEQGLEEIVVTAERRSSSVQKAATSIAVRTGEELEQQGRYTLQDILRDVPGVLAPDSPAAVNLGGSDARGTVVVIRGVAGSPGTGGAGNPLSGQSTTGVYVDGVYEGIGGDYDLQRVEVLRGPQGTLYGRSATSGVLATYSRDPNFDGLSADAAIQAGTYSLARYTGALNVTLSDKLAVRASGLLEQQDRGYYNGAGGAYDRLHGRIKALFRPTDNFSVLAGFAFEENDSNTGGCSALSTALGVITYANIQNNCRDVKEAHNQTRQYWLNVEWDLGGVTLYYQPALRDYKQDSVFQVAPPIRGFSPFIQTFSTPYDRFHTQELRLASNGTGKLKWQTGVFYYWNKAQADSANLWQSSGAPLFLSNSVRTVTDIGVFGEGTYAFTDTTRITLGLRYDYTRVLTNQIYQPNKNSFAQQGSPGQTLIGIDPLTGKAELNRFVINATSNPSGLRSWRKINYKARIEQDLTPRNLVYAMVSTGFIPGDVSVNSGQGVQPYEAETLTAYEIGSKNRFLGGKLQVNASAFYYDYGGFTIQVLPDATVPGGAYITTVPAKLWGGELETLFQVTPRDRLSVNYAYLGTRYVNKPAKFATDISWNTFGETAGRTGNFTAPHTVVASFEHMFDFPGNSNLSVRMDGVWTSRFRYSNPSNTLLAKPVVGLGVLDYIYRDAGVIANVNVNWTSGDGRFGIGAYVRNFTDKRWIYYDVRNLTTAARDVRATESTPRTGGVIFSAKF